MIRDEISQSIEQLKDPKLKSLNLSLVEMRFTDDELNAICNALAANTTLNFIALDLSCSNIRNKGARAIFNASTANKTLTSIALNLWANKIGNKGAEALANAIKENTTLTSITLNLAVNNIGEKGADSIANAIKENTTLTSITLIFWNSNIGEKGAEAITNAIKANKNIIHCSFNDECKELAKVNKRNAEKIVEIIFKKLSDNKPLSVEQYNAMWEREAAVKQVLQENLDTDVAIKNTMEKQGLKSLEDIINRIKELGPKADYLVSKKGLDLPDPVIKNISSHLGQDIGPITKE